MAAAAEQRVEELVFRSRVEGDAAAIKSMAQIEAAFGKAGTAIEATTRTHEQAGRAVGNIVSLWQRQEAQLAGAGKAWAELGRQMRTANRAMDAGVADAKSYGAAVDQIVRNFQRAVAPDLSMNFDTTALREAAASARVFDEEMRRSLTGMLKDAEAGERALKDQAKAADDLAMRARQMREAIDPLAVAQRRMNEGLAEARSLQTAGAVTDAEVILRTKQLNEEYQKVARTMGAANENIRLTSGQVQNLGYQANDVATMMLMGASPFQIIASQAGQVVQALGDGPGGVKGSLSAIGSGIASFARAIPTGVYAVAGLTAAVGALWYATSGPEARSAEESIKSFEDAVKRLEDGWKGAGQAAEDHYRRARSDIDASRPSALLDAQRDYEALRKDLQQSLRDLNTASNLPEHILRVRAGPISAAHQEIRDLYTAALRLDLPVQDLVRNMERIRLDPNADAYARLFAEEIRRAADNALDLQLRLEAMRAAAQGAGGRGPRVTTSPNAPSPLDLRDLFGGGNTLASRMDPEAYDTFVRSLREGNEEMIENQRLLNAYPEAVEAQKKAMAASVAELRLQIDTFGESEGVIAEQRFVIEALAEAQREAAATNKGVIDPTIEKEIRRQGAQIRVMTDEYAALTEAQRESVRASQEAERARQRLDDMARDQAEELRLLQAEAGFIHLNDGARRVMLAGLEAESELRRQGIDLNDAWGQSYVENARRIAEMDGVLDKQREAFDNLESSVSGFFQALANGGGILDGAMKAFQGFASGFVSQGLERLFGGAGAGSSPASPRSSPASVVAGVPQLLANVPATAYVPTPTPAIRQATQRLAEGVTTSVSGNLLRGMLSAGKSQEHISGLNRDFAAALTNMFSEAPDAVRSATKIFSGFRSVERQAEIFAQAVKKYGSEAAARKWAAPPGRSFHNSGMAADLSYASPSARSWIHQNAGRYGLNFPMGHEPWHIELTGARGGVARSLERGASAGVEKAMTRVLAPSGGFAVAGSVGNVPIPTARPGGSAGAGTAGMGGFGGLQNLLRSPFGQGAMNAFGAFSAGASGGPLSGALTGGLGAIGMGLGPVGIGLGVLAGIGGSLAKNLFNKKEREQKHRQLAEQWSQMLPQWREFQERMRTGTGPTSGLRASFAADDAALDEFMRVGGQAWKYGSENSTALHWQTGLNRYAYQDRTRAAFRDGFGVTEGALLAGQGLEGPWVKARDAIRQASESILTFVDDTRVAFGESMPEVQRAQAAGVEQLRAALRGAQELSQTQSDIQALRGGAAALHDQFLKLDVSAEDAARAIEEDLNVGLSKVAQNLNESIRDRIEDLAGFGYFGQVRDFLAEFETLKTDVSVAGADPSGLPDLFRRQLQAIVDGARLTGGAFDGLIAMFPQLRDVVTAFSETAVASAADIATAIRGFDDRFFAATDGDDLAAHDRRVAREREEVAKLGGAAILAFDRATAAERAKIVMDQARQFASGRMEAALRDRTRAEDNLRAAYERMTTYARSLRDFVRDMRLDANLSPFGGREQFEEAQRAFRETLFKANGGDTDAQDGLADIARTYLEAGKAYWASSPEFAEVFREVETSLKATATRAESELDVARRQATFLQEIAAGTKGLPALLQELIEAQKRVTEAGRGVDAARDWGINPVRNQTIVAGWRAAGLPEYMGNFGPSAARGAELAAYLNSLDAAQRAQAQAIINSNIHINRAWGGSVWGPGDRSSDSIRANLSDGEFIVSRPAVDKFGRSRLDHLNVTGELPGGTFRPARELVRDPYPTPIRDLAPPPMRGEGFASREEVREMNRKLDRIADILGAGFTGSIDATDRLGRSTEQSAAAARRAASRPARVA